MGFLNVSQDDVTFHFEEGKQMKTKVQIENITNKKVTFKIRTTNPAVFFVQPFKGDLNPNEQLDLQFSTNTLSQKEVQKIMSSKFQLQAFQLEGNESIQQIEELWKQAKQNTQIQTVHLSVEIYQIENDRKVFFSHNKDVKSNNRSGVSSSLYHSIHGTQKKFISGLNQTQDQNKKFAKLGEQYASIQEKNYQLKEVREKERNNIISNKKEGKDSSSMKGLIVILVLGFLLSTFVSRSLQ